MATNGPLVIAQGQRRGGRSGGKAPCRRRRGPLRSLVPILRLGGSPPADRQRRGGGRPATQRGSHRAGHRAHSSSDEKRLVHSPGLCRPRDRPGARPVSLRDHEPDLRDGGRSSLLMIRRPRSTSLPGSTDWIRRRGRAKPGTVKPSCERCWGGFRRRGRGLRRGGKTGGRTGGQGGRDGQGRAGNKGDGGRSSTRQRA